MRYHQKNNPKYRQANGKTEAFNKILKCVFTKICNIERDYWDEIVLIVLCAYRTRCIILTKHAPLWLVYDKKAMIPMEFTVLSLRITWPLRCLIEIHWKWGWMP